MSALLESPKVTVHVGDSFKFLETHEATYDVIIADSSDPVGPAKSLFQKPYFKLLHDALTPGGHISTQGECLWLHLPLIRSLRSMTRELFATSEYAYTTIPTYPSGQVGFMICAKARGSDLKTPLREVKGTKYYNKDLHRSAFNLPEFARAYLEEDKDLRPKFGREGLNATQGKPKKILLLGAGFVARPCAEYIIRDPHNYLTIASRSLKSAEALAADLPNASAISLDVSNTPELEGEVVKHDLVISLIPYIHHASIIKVAIKVKVHVVTTSYVSPAMRELDAAAKEAGIVIFNEIGLDPGIDHLYAVKTIAEVHENGGKVNQNRAILLFLFISS
jgi:spermidine synthase